MDDFQRSHFYDQGLGKTNAELIDGVVSHLRLTRDAMSQAAMMGNLGIAGIYEAELAKRAGRTGDNSYVDVLRERIEITFGNSQGPRGKERR
jgi:hypothetical protein